MIKNKEFILSEVKDYVLITLDLLLYSIASTIFLMPYEIVTGGVIGMSAIIYYATGFKLESIYMIISISLLIVALKILGFRFMMKTIYAIFALYFMLMSTQSLTPLGINGNFIKVLGEGQDFMSMVIGCCITGSSLAVVFLNNGSIGGPDIIAACVNKYKDMSLGQVLILVDIFIVSSCFFFPQFGEMAERAHEVVFGYCTIIIECFMLDFVFARQRQSAQFMIYSRKHKEIAEILSKETDHGLTILDGHDWHTGQEIKVTCLLARKSESQLIFRLIKMTNPNAFVSQSSVIGVYGEGLDQIRIKIKKKHENSLRSKQQERTSGNS